MAGALDSGAGQMFTVRSPSIRKPSTAAAYVAWASVATP